MKLCRDAHAPLPLRGDAALIAIPGEFQRMGNSLVENEFSVSLGHADISHTT